MVTTFACWVAQQSVLFLVGFANHCISDSSSIGRFLAADPDIWVVVGTVRRADAASKGVEAITTFRVPHGARLLAALTVLLVALAFVPDNVAGASPVGRGLQTVSTSV